jgi:septum formation protein
VIDDFEDFPLPPQLGWMDEQPLLLASASETRMAMLVDAGLPVVVSPSDVDESVIKQRVQAAGGPAAEAAMALALEKAATVSRSYPGQITVGADQILVLDDGADGEIWFDKPENRGKAHKHLQQLSGKTHQLLTATCVCVDGEERWSSLKTSNLSMRALSDAYIRAYLDTLGDEVLWSVGGYQLEGLGSQLFEQVKGDFFTILGLDLTGLLAHFRDQQALLA